MLSAPRSFLQPAIRQASFDDQTVQFMSRSGFPRWDEVSVAAQLLARSFKPFPPSQTNLGKTLLLGCGHGALGIGLALRYPKEQFWLSDQNYIATKMIFETIRLNTLDNTRLIENGFPGTEYDNSFSSVLIEIPKGRKLCRRWLMKAHACLESSGQLYVAGANQEGIQSIIQDTESLFGNVKLLSYRKGNRVARATKISNVAFSLPAWAYEPGIALGTWYEFTANIDQMSLTFRTLPGIFSYDGIDEGTRLLLSVLEITPLDRVLDFGCGYGVIGLFASKKGASRVDMIDVDLMAVACAHENIHRNNLSGVHILAGDGIEAIGDQQYSLIISNPPFHTGREVDYQISEMFIHQSRQALVPGGRLVIVANRFIRYDQLMQKVFPKVSIPMKTSKYHVISGSN